MVINSSGLVGIGTFSPSVALEVQSANTTILSRSTGDSPAKIALNSNRATNRNGGRILGQWNGTTVSSIDFVNGLDSTNKDDGQIVFSTAEAGTTLERMRIKAGGNVGIGTNDPTTRLHISDGNAAITLASTSTNNSGAIYFKGKDASGNSFATFQINTTSKGSVNIETNPNNSAFSTASFIAFKQDGTEKMRINSDGKVGIGIATPNSLLEVRGGASSGGIISRCTTTQSNSTNRGLRVRNNSSVDTFYVGFNGQSRIYTDNDALELYADVSTANTGGSKGHLLIKRGTNNVQVGSITSDTTSAKFNTSSDYRLKENVVGISDGITRVKQLQPKRFNFIIKADTTVDGFLAHEAQAVVPEAVTGTHNEVDDDNNPVYQSIDQSKLVPLLTAALQEAIAKIETLETKVAALEAA